MEGRQQLAVGGSDLSPPFLPQRPFLSLHRDGTICSPVTLAGFQTWAHSRPTTLHSVGLRWGVMPLPPFSMIPHLINQVCLHQVTLLFTAPLWPAQPRFSAVLELVCEDPLLSYSPSSPAECARSVSSPDQPGTPILADLQLSRGSKSLSESASLLLREARDPVTRRGYPYAWRHWSGCCLARQADPSSAPVTLMLNFLT